MFIKYKMLERYIYYVVVYNRKRRCLKKDTDSSCEYFQNYKMSKYCRLGFITVPITDVIIQLM